MIFATHCAPLLVLKEAISDKMKMYIPGEDEHVLVLLPTLQGLPTRVHKKLLQADKFRIAFDYRGENIEYRGENIESAIAAFEASVGEEFREFSHLRQHTQIPYSILVSSTIRRAPCGTLEIGSGLRSFVECLTSK